MLRFLLLLLYMLPVSVRAQDEPAAEPAAPAADMTSQYGLGLLCPRPGTQVIFYTQSNQQDAAGTIDYKPAQGFVITSNSVRDMAGAGAASLDSYCDGKLPGIRIDALRDGWMLAGRIWLPPNQEWSYIGWTELLRKSAIWKPLSVVGLYSGTMQEAAPDKPYANSDAPLESLEIYPIKLLDNYALVLVDESGSFAKSCAGQPAPPSGRLGWMRLYQDDGKPVAVPAHPKGC
jgi:hypothetical protein